MKENVAILIINNPQKANCLNETLWFEIESAMDMFGRDQNIQTCIIKSMGKHFSSGIDIGFLKSILGRTEGLAESERSKYLYEYIQKMQRALSAIENFPRPVIALIHGLCLGAGVDLVSACDMRFSTKSSIFSILETRLGIVADMGTLQRLTKIVGDEKLKEWAYSSKMINAFEAKKYQLVSRTFFSRRCMEKAAIKLSKSFISMPLYALEGTKQTINFSRDHSVGEGLEFVAQLNAKLLLSDQAKEQFRKNFTKEL